MGAEVARSNTDDALSNMFSKATVSKGQEDDVCLSMIQNEQNIHIHSDYPIWAGDSNVRRSPEGILNYTTVHINKS